MMVADSFDASKSVLLRGVCFIYVLFFCIISLESKGLLGSTGVEPIPTEYFCKNELLYECFKKNPSVFSLGGLLDLGPDQIIEILSLIGVVLGSLGFLFQSFQAFPVFLILWLTAYSFYKVGSPFFKQICDIYLLEVGFLVIFYAFKSKSTTGNFKDDVIKFLVKCLYFRMLLSSGFQRLLNLNEHASDLKESERFTEAQYLPAPLAWYLHNTDSLASILLFHATLLSEIVLPFAIFVSPFFLIALHFSLTLSLQVISIFTGNYGIYPLFVSLLGLFVMVDSFENEERIKRKIVKKRSFITFVMSALTWAMMFLMSYVVYQFFASPTGGLSTLLREGGIRDIVTNFQKMSMIFTFLMYLFVIYTWCANVNVSSIMIPWNWLLCCILVIPTTVFGCYWLLRTSSQQTCLFSVKPCALGSYNSFFDQKLSLSPKFSPGPYGAPDGIQFMSSLSVEVANSEEGPWKTLHYKSSVPDFEKELPLNGLHLSRFEHELWMAAHSTIESNPWLYSLVYRILQGSSSVMQLFKSEKFPKKEPPKFVRLVKTIHHFNKACSKIGLTECKENKWVSKPGEVYLSPINLSNADLKKHILQSKLGSVPKNLSTEPIILEQYRSLIQGIAPAFITWGLIVHHAVLFIAIKLLQL